jgi:hypothetical protein
MQQRITIDANQSGRMYGTIMTPILRKGTVAKCLSVTEVARWIVTPADQSRFIFLVARDSSVIHSTSALKRPVDALCEDPQLLPRPSEPNAAMNDEADIYVAWRSGTQVKVEMRDGVAVDFVVQLDRVGRLSEAFRGGHGIEPKVDLVLG